MFKEFAFLATVLGITSANLIQQPLPCPSFSTLNIDYKIFNGKVWYEIMETMIPPGQKCSKDIFDTFSNNPSFTYITRSYVNTTTGQQQTSIGSLSYPGNAPFTVNMAGYPANGNYYLVDYYDTYRTATFCMCFDMGNGNGGTLGWTLMADIQHNSLLVPQAIQYGASVLESKCGIPTAEALTVPQDC